MVSIEEQVERAREIVGNPKEKLVLPFCDESLNRAYILMKLQYKEPGKAQSIQIPEKIADEAKKASFCERALAEHTLHAFVGSLIRDFWNGAEVQIGYHATGSCKLHKRDRYEFSSVLTDEQVDLIKSTDNVLTDNALTAMTVGECPIHHVPLNPEVSYLEYTLLDQDMENPVTRFQSRVKSSTLPDKLTRVIIGERPYAVDMRGARIICRDMDSYYEAADYLMRRLQRNHDIAIVPVTESLEEKVAASRDPARRLESIYPYMKAMGLETEISSSDTTYGSPDYESFHATLRYGEADEGKELIETQIRTEKMHEKAEKGTAAHHDYTDRQKADIMKRYPDYDDVRKKVKEIFSGLVLPDITSAQSFGP